MENSVKLQTKSEFLAKIIYKAIVRYVKAKKVVESGRKPNFRLDSERIWRSNTEEIIVELEK